MPGNQNLAERLASLEAARKEAMQEYLASWTLGMVCLTKAQLLADPKLFETAQLYFQAAKNCLALAQLGQALGPEGEFRAEAKRGWLM